MRIGMAVVNRAADEDEVLPPREILQKVSTALRLVARGDPLVSLRQELATRFDAIETRFAQNDKATQLVHDDYVRVPTQVDKAVEALRNLLEQKVAASTQVFDSRIEATDKVVGRLQDTVDALPALIADQIVRSGELIDETIKRNGEVTNERITSLADVTTQMFKSVNDTFSEKDKAVSVGLSAQKESAAATQDFNSAATNKMEENFTKLLDQGRELLAESRKNAEIQIADIKSRLDKREGMTNVMDPAVTDVLRELTAEVRSLRMTERTNNGIALGTHDSRSESRASTGQIMVALSVVFSGVVMAIAILPIFHH